jgi:hypothetical protein
MKSLRTDCGQITDREKCGQVPPLYTPVSAVRGTSADTVRTKRDCGTSPLWAGRPLSLRKLAFARQFVHGAAFRPLLPGPRLWLPAGLGKVSLASLACARHPNGCGCVVCSGRPNRNTREQHSPSRLSSGTAWRPERLMHCIALGANRDVTPPKVSAVLDNMGLFRRGF